MKLTNLSLMFSLSVVIMTASAHAMECTAELDSLTPGQLEKEALFEANFITDRVSSPLLEILQKASPKPISLRLKFGALYQPEKAFTWVTAKEIVAKLSKFGEGSVQGLRLTDSNELAFFGEIKWVGSESVVLDMLRANPYILRAELNDEEPWRLQTEPEQVVEARPYNLDVKLVKGAQPYLFASKGEELKISSSDELNRELSAARNPDKRLEVSFISVYRVGPNIELRNKHVLSVASALVDRGLDPKVIFMGPQEYRIDFVTTAKNVTLLMADPFINAKLLVPREISKDMPLNRRF